MNIDFNNKDRVLHLWGVFVDNKGNFDCMSLEIIEKVSGKKKQQQVAAVFTDKEGAEHFATACAKKWPDKDFYVQECKVARKL